MQNRKRQWHPQVIHKDEESHEKYLGMSRHQELHKADNKARIEDMVIQFSCDKM
jgi:hypothetical protein